MVASFVLSQGFSILPRAYLRWLNKPLILHTGPVDEAIHVVHVLCHHLSFFLVDQLLALGVNVTVYNGQLDMICDTVGELPVYLHFTKQKCAHFVSLSYTHALHL